MFPIPVTEVYNLRYNLPSLLSYAFELFTTPAACGTTIDRSDSDFTFCTLSMSRAKSEIRIWLVDSRAIWDKFAQLVYRITIHTLNTYMISQNTSCSMWGKQYLGTTIYCSHPLQLTQKTISSAHCIIEQQCYKHSKLQLVQINNSEKVARFRQSAVATFCGCL